MPPRPGLIPDERRLKASTIFVDREGPIEVFTRAAAQIPADGPKLLVFYGVGGQGKTSLCRKLVEIAGEDPALSHLRAGSVDLHGRPERGAALGLVWLRNALARGKGTKLSFVAFDIAFAHYWQLTRPDQPMPSFAARWLGRHDDFASDTTSAAGEAVGEVLQGVEGVVQDLAAATPIVGMALRRLTGWAIQKGRHEFHKRTNDALQHLFDQGDLIPPHEIERLLPYFLARDLDTHLEAHGDDRFVLFIDEYERVFDRGTAGSVWTENPLDKAIRDFAAETNGTLLVFFSREKLPWAEIDPDWEPDLKDAQHLLHGLSEKDARVFLQKAGITYKAVREAMIEGASTQDPRSGEPTTFPIMLDLQVDHYYALSGDVAPEDFRVSATGFEKRRNELVARFLRDYDNPLEATLKRLALTRWFDRDVFAHLVRTFATGFQLDAFKAFTRLSFIDAKQEPGRYGMHTLIREAIEDITDEATIAETHNALFEYYDGRSSVDDPLKFAREQLEAIAEAVHHTSFGEYEDTVEWWKERREPLDNPAFAAPLELLDRRMLNHSSSGGSEAEVAWHLNTLARNLNAQGRYKEAESLYTNALELRERALGTEHADTSESCNNLAFNLNAQGRYEDAEPIYRRAMKIAEKALGKNSFEYAGATINLGMNLNAQGHYGEAEQLFTQGLEILKSVEGEESHFVAATFNCIGFNLSSQGRFDEAHEPLSSALSIFEKALGTDHPDTATSYCNVASNLDDLGRFSDAEPLHQKALNVFEHSLGAEHPSTAIVYGNLAANLISQGRTAEAEPYARTALQVHERSLGEGHISTGRSCQRLAAILNDLGSYVEAEPLIERAMAVV